MYLIVGLGNPDKKYEKTRHNVGFWVVDFLVDRFGLDKFKLEGKFKSAITRGEWDDKKVIIVKPQTYMNNSGMAIQLLKNYFKIQSENIIVIYDELDLPFEEIRVRHEGSSAGHNGIKSIIDYLSTDRFTRIRIGIRNKLADKLPAEKFVLSRFSFWEKRKLKNKILPKVEKEVLGLLGE
jgi:PTH1 family peptidyl-tRNA hydrolase